MIPISRLQFNRPDGTFVVNAAPDPEIDFAERGS
jgi:hypothetical protein